jgi:EAL domain-containing protein (putative c-di-GMP-specific phosphodiesterase class I)
MLLRLNTDDGRVVEPGAFIPAAERYNLMPLLDRWVVRHALNYVAANLDVPGAAEMYFINLSGATLSDDSFYDYIREQIIEAAVSPDRLCFEITETAAIANLNRAVSFIREIRELGCHFALDDFGAGMSSFSYLKAIPVDYIKIDGSFIKDIVQDPMDYAIVEAINRIGHTAGLQTIAEFVEEAATLESLRGLRVDYAQGYHISYPLPTVC